MTAIARERTFEAAASVRLLPGAVAVGREHLLAGQQHDNLCGPFWAAIMLRSRGLADVGTEDVATLAGSVLPTWDPSRSVPRGATPRIDYRVSLPTTARPEDAGTAIGALIESVDRASNGSFALVPLRTEWSSEAVKGVLSLCRDHAEWEATPLCNVRTGRLWGSHPSLVDVLAYLSGTEIVAPEPEWDVGHFVCIAGTIDGPVRSLVLVRDTYPMFGWGAHHVQPAGALADALNRGDGHEGGIALFVSNGDAPDVERAAKDAGFDVAAWDNGTPWIRG